MATIFHPIEAQYNSRTCFWGFAVVFDAAYENVFRRKIAIAFLMATRRLQATDTVGKNVLSGMGRKK